MWYTEDSQASYHTVAGEFMTTPGNTFSPSTPLPVSAWSSTLVLPNQYTLHCASVGSHVHFLLVDTTQFQAKPRHCIVRCPGLVLPTPVAVVRMSDTSRVELSVFVLCEGGILVPLGLSVERVAYAEMPTVDIRDVSRIYLRTKEKAKLQYIASGTTIGVESAFLLHGEDGAVVELAVHEPTGKTRETLLQFGVPAGGRSWLNRLAFRGNTQKDNSSTATTILSTTTVTTLTSQKTCVVALVGSELIRVYAYIPGLPKYDSPLTEFALPRGTWNGSSLETIVSGSLNAFVVTLGMKTYFYGLEENGDDVSVRLLTCVSSPHESSQLSMSMQLQEACGTFGVLSRCSRRPAQLLSSPICVLAPQSAVRPVYYALNVQSPKRLLSFRAEICCEENEQRPIAFFVSESADNACVWWYSLKSMKVSVSSIPLSPTSRLDSITRTLETNNLDVVDRQHNVAGQFPIVVPHTASPQLGGKRQPLLQDLITFLVKVTGPEWSLPQLVSVGCNLTSAIDMIARKSLKRAIEHSQLFGWDSTAITNTLAEYRAALSEDVNENELISTEFNIRIAVESATELCVTNRVCHAALFAVAVRLLTLMMYPDAAAFHVVSEFILSWYIGLYNVIVSNRFSQVLTRQEQNMEDYVKTINRLLPTSLLSPAVVAFHLPTGRVLSAWLRPWGSSRPDLAHFYGVNELKCLRGASPYVAADYFAQAARYLEGLESYDEQLDAIRNYVHPDDMDLIESNHTGAENPLFVSTIYRQRILGYFLSETGQGLCVPSAVATPLIGDVLMRGGPYLSIAQQAWYAYVRQLIDDGDYATAHSWIVSKPEAIVPESSTILQLMKTLTRSCLSHPEGRDMILKFVCAGDAVSGIYGHDRGAGDVQSRLLTAMCSEIYAFSRQNINNSLRGPGASGSTVFETATQLLFDVLIRNGLYGLAARIAVSGSDVLRRGHNWLSAMNFHGLAIEALEQIPSLLADVQRLRNANDPDDEMLVRCASSSMLESEYVDMVPMTVTMLPIVRRQLLHLHACQILDDSGSLSFIWESEGEEVEAARRAVEGLTDARYWDLAARLASHYDIPINEIVSRCTAYCVTTNPPQWAVLRDFLKNASCLLNLPKAAKQQQQNHRAAIASNYDCAFQTACSLLDTDSTWDTQVIQDYVNVDAARFVATAVSVGTHQRALFQHALSVCQEYVSNPKPTFVLSPVLMDCVLKMAKNVDVGLYGALSDKYKAMVQGK
eukprot:PhF_6_TR11598/c0_g1_i1/m.18780